MTATRRFSDRVSTSDLRPSRVRPDQVKGPRLAAGGLTEGPEGEDTREVRPKRCHLRRAQTSEDAVDCTHERWRVLPHI